MLFGFFQFINPNLKSLAKPNWLANEFRKRLEFLSFTFGNKPKLLPMYNSPGEFHHKSALVKASRYNQVQIWF